MRKGSAKNPNKKWTPCSHCWKQRTFWTVTCQGLWQVASGATHHCISKSVIRASKNGIIRPSDYQAAKTNIYPWHTPLSSEGGRVGGTLGKEAGNDSVLRRNLNPLLALTWEWTASFYDTASGSAHPSSSLMTGWSWLIRRGDWPTVNQTELSFSQEIS